MVSDAPEGLCARCLLSVAMKEPSTPEAPQINAASPEEIARHFPQFEILELIGRGGMGVVYKARQRQLDRIVALKILPPESGADPQFAERFAREGRALARLNHPNIVAVHDFGQTAAAEGASGLFYLVMEFIDGANLRQLLQTKSIAPEQAIAIVPRICEALQFAHEEGVMHRDIKPENILIDKRGRVKIADFGLAKILGVEPQDYTLTQSGMSVGTPRYMAPEQMDHPELVDHRADIYSLGVVFYEMLTGELPMGRFAPPSEKVHVDVRLDEVVLRSLERDVSRRYQHASEVRSDVEDISGVSPKMSPLIRQMLGFEYRSKREFFGWPLLHVTSGVDPTTGKRRVAQGIIAMGDSARGVIAFGGLAIGVFAFGGMGIGVVSFSGVSLGVLSMGGVAAGLLFAYGGIAIAPVALGGAAIGYVAAGGSTIGAHTLTRGSNDPGAAALFRQWWAPMQILFFTLLPFVIFVPIGVRIWAERKLRLDEATGGSKAASSPSAGASAGPAPNLLRWLAIVILSLFLLVIGGCAVGLILPAWQKASAERRRGQVALERPRSSDPKVEAVESRVDAALLIRDDTARHQALAAIALEAAENGYAGPMLRAVDRMSFVTERDNTAARCAKAIAKHNLTAATQAAKLIMGDTERDHTLRAITRGAGVSP